MLEFKGIQKTTLVDYPNEVACTFFTAGCNFNCAYCYNPDLALGRDTGVSITKFEALEFLEERKGFLDAVCITGGEPLMHADLIDFLERAKSLDYKIKIDTNGSYPEALREIIKAKAADYLAMDIKGPLTRYPEIAGAPVDLSKIEESASLIKNSGLDYEFRTTVFNGLSFGDFDNIGRWLSGSRKYCLQPVKVNLPLLAADFPINNQSPSAEDLQEISRRISPYFDKVEVRK